MDTRLLVSPEVREWRRMRAWELKQQGWAQRDIAAALGITEAAVSRGMAGAGRDAPDALPAPPAPAPTPKLTPAQKRLTPDFLWQGPEAYGFGGEVWPCSRLARAIEEELGVRY